MPAAAGAGWRGGGDASGKYTRNVVPMPGSEYTLMLPPASVTMP